MITTENMYKAFLRAVDALKKNEDTINKANVFPVPDGDTGSNMLLTLKNALEKTPQPSSLAQFGQNFSYNILRSARGNSGVILSVAISAFFDIEHENDGIFTPAEIAKGLSEAKKQVYSTVSFPKEGTMLTMISALSDCAKKYCSLCNNDGNFLEELLKESKHTLDTRCCESPEQKKTSLPDSGALGLFFIIEGMIKTSENVFLANQSINNEAKESATENFEEKPYCTQFIIDKNKDANAALCEEFSFFVKETGASSLVVDSGSFIKVHTHTDRPGEVLTRALKLGSLSEIEIENMLLQSKKTSPSTLAVAAMYSGNGTKEILESLGVTLFISSGKSYNPETDEILSVLNSSEENNIFLITNHKNSVLAAKQAAKLSHKKVSVIPAHCIGEQIAALSVFNENESMQNNALNLTKAISTAKTLDISIASKDAVINNAKVKKGQYIAFTGKNLSVNESTLSAAAVKAAKLLLGKTAHSLTIIYGDETDKYTAEAIKSKIENSFTRKTEITLLQGNQKIYCMSLLAD